MQKARHHQRQRYAKRENRESVIACKHESEPSDKDPDPDYTFSPFHLSTSYILLAPALTACRHTVSGSISLPSRGAFHLSLTVLLRYQSPNVFSLTRWSSRIHPGFLVSRATRDPATLSNPFRLRDFHPLRSNFPDRFVYEFDSDVAVPLPRPKPV